MKMRRRGIIGLVALCASLAVAAPASAYELTTYAPGSFFDGTGSDENLFGSTIRGIAVDEVSGSVYVLTGQSGVVVDKFDASGTPTAFSAPSLAGANSLNLGVSDSALRIAVDNSATATQGRIYVLTSKASSEAALYAFNADGSPVTGENYPVALTSSGGSIAGDIAVDPSTGEIWVATSGTPATGPGNATKFFSTGIRSVTTFPLTGANSAQPHIALDGAGNLYEQMGAATYKYDTGNGQLLYAIASSGAVASAVDIDVNTADGTLWDVDPTSVTQYTLGGTRVARYASPSGGNARVAVNRTNGRLYVGSQGAGRVDILTPGGATTVPNVTTGQASDFHATDVVLHGTIDPDGVDTDDCHFEWSTDMSFGNSTPCTGGNVLSGSGDQQVEAHVTGLVQGATYKYRLVAGNANTPPTGQVIGRQDSTFVPSAAPTVGGDQYADDVASTGFLAHAAINPGGAPTSYHVEYGLADCATITCSVAAGGNAGSMVGSSARSLMVDGLTPDTTYHYRTVAVNQSGTDYGDDRVITTFPATVFDDTCPNAHVRQQVSAAFLPDCRAYELVSAADTGGYEVESDLVAGQEPFGSYPRAKDRALYGIHNGAIPGPWNPTNHGVDPYIATRGPGGWSTDYAGIPADNPNAGGPFSSSLYAASADLSTFAFGGADICDPCFADGSSGLPVHMPDGSLVQGMTGSTPDASASQAGIVHRRFSEDGANLLFGTTAQLESSANSNGTDVTLYERNLVAGTTEVVSTDETGATIANGDGVAVLDVSEAGDRVVVGSQVGAPDASGNRHYHLYMHLAGIAESIDLMPGATQGALYGGMTSDGSKVYFTTHQALTTAADQDTDSSGDLFRADVSNNGSLSLIRVSARPGEAAGGIGDTDGCSPVGNTVNEHWNAVSGAGDCSAVAIGAGGGVASDDGSVYFLSPEVLDTGSTVPPTPDGPNLYLAEPGGDPHFVTTLESRLTGPYPLPTAHSLVSTISDSDFNNPQQMAVDQTTGDLYVLNQGTTPRGVLRFHADGTPHDFTAGPNAGTNILTGFTFNAFSTGQVAVDNSAGSTNGTIYVTNNQSTVAGRVVRSFARDGTPLATISGSSTPQGGFGEGSGVWRFPTGVAVAPNGDVYIAGGVSGKIYRYVPQPAAQSVVSTDYHSTLNFGEGASGTPVSLAVDSSGAVYAGTINVTTIEPGISKFAASQFGVAGVQTGTEIDPNGYIVHIDPVSGFIYTNDRTSITEYRPDGTLQSSFGAGEIGVGSRGVAVQGSGDGTTSTVYVADQDADVVYVFDSSISGAAVKLIDNPLVVDAVNDAGTRDTADFQVTPDGRFAAFGSTISLLGDDNGDKREIFRYDVNGDRIDCASCNPTGARAMGDAALAPDGLSLIDNGQLFFNSNDALAARDLDKRQDVYKWDGDVPKLISTGTSQFHASLLGASADGTDVFFFTRDRLVPEDENGILVKLYDARAGGGFEFVPDPVSCKASDECHGAGSPAPGPAAINTLQGSRGNVAHKAKRSRCPAGKRAVRRHGKVRCVKAHGKRKHRGKRRHEKRANANRGGAK